MTLPPHDIEAKIEDSVCSIFDEVIAGPSNANLEQAMEKWKHLSQSLLEDYAHEKWYAHPFRHFERFNKLMTEAFELHGRRPRKQRRFDGSWNDYDAPTCARPDSVRELLEKTVPFLLYILQIWLEKQKFEYKGFETIAEQTLQRKRVRESSPSIEQRAPVIKTVEQALRLKPPWNYYQVLDVDQDASDEDIKRAYKRLALLWHPDKYKESSEIEKRVYEECFKLIANAYESLQNKSGRDQYNAKRALGYKHPAWTTNGQCRFKTVDLTQAFLVFEKAFNNPYLCKFY
jgi:hypothetical protein